MDLNSKKFKYLFAAKKLLDHKIVPAFEKLNKDFDYRESSQPYIMRSAIKGEATEAKLLSGKSLSIPGIKSKSDYERAYQEILNQPDLVEAILQEEISWEKHLTLIYEKDFIFVEIKVLHDETNKPQFLYWTPIGHTSGESGLLNTLVKLIKNLKSITETSELWLMELGLRDNALSLFQIQPVPPHFLGNIFSQNLVQEMLLSRHRFQKSHGLWAMVKTEWHAFVFRKKLSGLSAMHPSWIFLNWEFIFHYFRIYCLQKNLQPTQNSFAAFLTVGHGKNWMGEILRLHFKMANQLRLIESTDEVNFVFDQNPSYIFIGKGQIRGKIGSDFALLAELTPQAVYSLNSKTIILTKTFSLLSHGILAGIEKEMRIVAGIPEDFWEELLIHENICLDFDTRSIKIQ